MAATCSGMVVGSQAMGPLCLGRDPLLGLSLLTISPSKAPQYRPFYSSLYRQLCHCQSRLLVLWALSTRCLAAEWGGGRYS